MGASIEGTMVIKGLSAELDVSASEVFENLKIGFMAMGMARKGDWGISGDMIWALLGVTSDRPAADVDPTTGIFTLNGMRRLNAFADATAGLRWTHVGSSVEFHPPLSAEAEQTKDWVDPIIGVVLHTPGESRWHATLMADIGGFGVSSDFVWQLSPFVGYDVADWASLEVGWRFIDTDYATGDGFDRFAYDVLMQGPAGGVAFRF
jgi:hypothetical protein